MTKACDKFHCGDIVVGNESATGYSVTGKGVKCEVLAIDSVTDMIKVTPIKEPRWSGGFWVYPFAFDIVNPAGSSTSTSATKKSKQYDAGFEEGVKYGLMLQDSPWVFVKDELPDSSIKCLLTVSAIIPGVSDSIIEVYPHIVNRMDGYWVTNLGIHIDGDCVIAWMRVPEPYNPENK